MLDDQTFKVLGAIMQWIIAPVASAAGAPIASGLTLMELAGVWAGDRHAACVMPRLDRFKGAPDGCARVWSLSLPPACSPGVGYAAAMPPRHSQALRASIGRGRDSWGNVIKTQQSHSGAVTVAKLASVAGCCSTAGSGVSSYNACFRKVFQ